MEYLRPYAFSGEEALLAAWETQVSEISRAGLSLATCSRAELFSRFAKTYAELRRLPRGARRAMQRRLAHSVPAWQARFATSVAGAALLLALAQGAQAATITVNTLVPKIKDGDGLCSLIEAIINANNDAATHADCAAGSGADVIQLPAASTIKVTKSLTKYYGRVGLPAITSDITISGNAGKIAGKSGFRLFAVKSSGDLTLDNVTVSGGSERLGGVIFNYGSLTLTDAKVTNGRAHLGGGIFNGAAADLTIDGSEVSSNYADYGGGIYDYAGVLTITYSTIKNNSAFIDGGGMYERAGSVDLEYSMVAKNFSGRDGGGLHHRDSSVLIAYSTVSNNDTGFFGYGGAIFDRSGTIDIINSTLSGNTARIGGGIYNRSTMNISNTTVAKNDALDGGGIFTVAGDLTLARSLISGNSASFADQVDRFSGTVTRNNYNLFGANGHDGVVGFSPGATDIVPNVGVSSIFVGLDDNGGPTKTHALVAGSPAIDASPADADCAPADQRGVLRPQGPSCDIGSFEY
ncbi:MAG TPA: choice-of-anchor Q domain-containing protein [Candidatus Binatia bacterium]|nr:choice-of-anchor Q domain-containing protein [Candidatus Binatia bacterium]